MDSTELEKLLREDFYDGETQLLSIGQRGLDYLVASNRLPTRRIAGRVLIPVAELRKHARYVHPERIVG